MSQPCWHGGEKVTNLGIEADLRSAYDALSRLGDLKCKDFIAELAKASSAKTVNGAQLSVEGIRQLAEEILDKRYVYDGTESSTPLSKALADQNASGTIAEHFGANVGVVALSQADVMAIWVRPSSFTTSSNGLSSPATRGTMLHEVLHKFLGRDLHQAAASVARRLWGDGNDWVEQLQVKCF